MQRILYVNPSADISGAENSLLALLQGLDHSRYEPLLVCPGAGRLTMRAEAAHIRYLTCRVPALSLTGSLPEIGRDIVSLLPAARRWREFITREKIDLIHLNSFRIAIPCSLGARLAKRPVIWHIRDIPRTGLKRRLVRQSAALLADRVITVSDAVARTFVDDKARPSWVRVIYNGIRVSDFQPTVSRTVLREELGIAPETILVGAVGQLTPWKGYELLLCAMSDLQREQPRTRMLIVGEAIAPGFRVPRAWDNYAERLLQLRRELGVEESVRFLGYREDIPNLLSALDIYAHAAILPDPFPRSILEAMSVGLPIVAPASGGIPEMICDRESGWLYHPGDVPALEEAILTLAHNSELRTSLGNAARARCATEFSLTRHVAQVQCVYEEVTRAHRN